MSRKNGDEPGETFEVGYRDGWAYVIVFPQKNISDKVYPDEIINRMNLLGIPHVRTLTIRKIVEEASGKPVKVVQRTEGAKLASRISVTVSEDRLSATVNCTSPRRGGGRLLPSDIKKALTEKGVVSGIEEKLIHDVVRRKIFGQDVLVAKGKKAVNGRMAKIEYHFNVHRGKPYQQMDFGRINLKELNFIENKKKGDLLAKLLPPVKPENGRDVLGNTITAMMNGVKPELRPGINTELSADGMELYATADGNVMRKGDTILVEPVVTIDNVNYETGNIYFDGSVVINQSIADGFVVEAQGTIQVGKGVGKAKLKAGNNIVLKAGINGNQEGEIECGGDLYTKYIESTRVVCRGNIFSDEAIMHSEVSVWKNCILNGKRGEMIAGSAIIGGSLWCKKLGSIYDVKTTITIGIIPERIHEYMSLLKNLDKKRDLLNQLDEKILQQEKIQKTDPNNWEYRQKLQDLSASGESLNHEIEEMLKNSHEISRELKASRDSVVVVQDIMYNGTVISFGKDEFRAPQKGVRKTILKSGESGIQESGFNPYDPPPIFIEEKA